MMWGVLSISYLVGYFHRLSLSVVMDYLIIDLKIGDAALAGALTGSYAVVFVIMQIPTGLLVDYWGPRKTVTTGMLVAGVGSLIFALAPHLLAAFIGRILVGLGGSVIFVSIMKFQVNWFKASQFATITGFAGMVGNMGMAIGTTPLALMVTGFGWRQTYLGITAMTFLLASFCWLFVRDAPLRIADSNHIKEKRGFLDKSHPEQKISLSSGQLQLAQILKPLKKVICNFQTWPLLTSIFGLYGTLFAFAGAWSVTYLMQIYNFDRGQAANYMLVLTAGILIGLPLAGYLSDRLGRRKMPLLIIFAIYTIVWALFFAWNGGKPPVAALYPLFFVMGLCSGGGAIIMPLTKEVNDPAFAGIALSFVNIGPFAGMAILQTLMGYVLDLRWDGLMVEGMKLYPLASFRLLFVTGLITLILSFIFALFAIREKKV